MTSLSMDKLAHGFAFRERPAESKDLLRVFNESLWKEGGCCLVDRFSWTVGPMLKQMLVSTDNSCSNVLHITQTEECLKTCNML